MPVTTPHGFEALGRALPDDDPPPHGDAKGKANGHARHRFYSAAELHGLSVPSRCELVSGLIPSRTVTLLGGDGGTGKSQLALQLCCAASLGRQWLGMAVQHGPTIFVTAEDDKSEIHRRLVDIAIAEGMALADLFDVHICSLAGEDALLASLDTRTGTLSETKLFGDIEAMMVATKPVVVALDTLADFFPGNENDRALARQFIGKLRGLAIRHECAVVLLSHPSLTGLHSGSGTSGSTGWSNSVRSRLYLERIIADGYEANPDARLLSVKKHNYGRIGGEVTMTWQRGIFVADAPSTTWERAATSNKAERVFLTLLEQMAGQGRHVSAQPGPTYAPKVFAEHPDSEGVTKRAFTGAMELLLSQGKIAIAKHGSASRQRSHIVVASPSQMKGDGDAE